MSDGCARIPLAAARVVGGGASAGRSTVARVGFLGALVASFIAFAASPAWGEYLHTTVVGEYGKEGPKATGVSGGCNVAFHSATNRIYYFADQKIYGLERTGPGTVIPLGGGFPINAAINSACGDRHMAVDNTGLPSSGNIYAVPSTTSIYGWNSAGSQLPTFPVNVGGETCGVAVNNEGQVWGGRYSGQKVVKYTAAGASVGEIPIGYGFCKLAIDPTNNDLYVAPYSGSNPLVKYTAASGYTTKVNFPPAGSGNPGLAVNGAANRIYVASGPTVKSYDTTSGSLVETITPGGTASSVAVEEATDTLFVAPTNGAIKEISGAFVPEITTGEPEGNSKVTGLVKPAGGGQITECYFEFGTTTSYGSKEFCSPATPYNADQNVFANLPGLLGEIIYHYRLVARNVNGINFGTDKIITPHYVVGLKTEDAENVARSTATLKASFEGNGEETHYYFEWGPTTAYGTKSAGPPGDSAGSPTAPPSTVITSDAAGLQPDTTYHYRVVATNGLGSSPGNDRTFKTLPAVQSLTTEAATSVAPHSATLNASYLGDGDGTTYKFEWGKTAAYGNSTPQENAGSPSGPTALLAELTGLDLETTYHFRIVATNSLGTTIGTDQAFTTLPAVSGVTTLPATEISQDNVTLNGEFTGNGDATHYYFQWGPTTEYGNDTAEMAAGSPTGALPLSADLTNFEGYTTYHYRLVAANSLGTTYGADETFTTLPALLPEIEGTTASSITPTSATLGAEINPNRWTTVYLFDYGPTTDYGASTVIEDVIDGDNRSNHPVSVAVTGLQPGSTYHFRTVALNLTGTVWGPDQTFTTPDAPQIDLTFSSVVGQTSAHLGARVNSKSATTSVRFEYGISSSYGDTTSSSSIPPDTQGRDVGADVSALVPDVTYHFRAVATNQFGTTYGPDQTLRTASSPQLPIVGGQKPTRLCKRGLVRRHGKCVKRRKRHKGRHRGHSSRIHG